MKLYEVTWTETQTVKKKATIKAHSKQEAIDACMLDGKDEDILDIQTNDYRDWQAEERDQ